MYITGTSLSYDNGRPFSTHERDVDTWDNNCAEYHHGGWWYGACTRANLNGHYATPGTLSQYMYNNGWGGVIYYTFDEWRSLKSTELKFRRKD